MMETNRLTEFVASVLQLAKSVGMSSNADAELFVSANTFQGQLETFKRRVIVAKNPTAIGNEVFIWIESDLRFAYLSDPTSQVFIRVSEYTQLFGHVSDFFDLANAGSAPTGTEVAAGPVDNRMLSSNVGIFTTLDVLRAQKVDHNRVATVLETDKTYRFDTSNLDGILADDGRGSWHEYSTVISVG